MCLRGSRVENSLVFLIVPFWEMMSIQMTMVINFIWCMDVWLLLQRKVIRPKMTARLPLHFLGSLVQLLREISKLIEGKRIKPTAILTFDSTRVNAKNLAELEEILYGKDPTSPEGDDGVEPRLQLPDEVIEIMSKENP